MNTLIIPIICLGIIILIQSYQNHALRKQVVKLKEMLDNED